MATQYGIAAADGIVTSADASWATARDATSGTAANTGLLTTKAVGINFTSGGRAGATYTIIRSFFAFDTSGITTTVGTVSLKIYGRINVYAYLFVVKSEHGNPLVDADYDASIHPEIKVAYGFDMWMQMRKIKNIVEESGIPTENVIISRGI